MESCMTVETPLEIFQIVEKLKEDFTGKLTVPDIGTPEEREKKFLSRALAAFAIQHLASRNVDDAVATLVDGPGDGGIDAVDYTATSHRLWVLQSKYISTGRGEPELAEVIKFRNG